MGRWSRSVDLLKKSWGVLRQDKELMLFPILAAVGGIVVLAAFAAPVVTVFARGGETVGRGLPIWMYPVIFAFYVVSFTVTNYFGAALIGAANIRLEGGNPTLKDGFRIANSRFGAILAWSVVAATVGLVIQAIQQRAGVAGRIVGGLVGVAWSLITFLVMPVLIFEGVGVKDAVKRSAHLFKERWGEQVIGQASIGIVGFVLMLPGILAVAGGVGLVVSVTAVLGVAVAAVGVVYILVLACLLRALSGIFNVALYRFAATGEGTAVFSADELATTFRPKRSRR